MTTDDDGNLSAYALPPNMQINSDNSGNVVVQPYNGVTGSLEFNTSGAIKDRNSFQMGNTTDGKMFIRPRKTNNTDWDSTKQVDFDSNGNIITTGNASKIGGIRFTNKNWVGGAENVDESEICNDDTNGLMIYGKRVNGLRQVNIGDRLVTNYLQAASQVSTNQVSTNQLCIGETCIDENDLKKLKNNTFPNLVINGDNDYPIEIRDRPSGKKTSLIRFNTNRAFGVDGRNNLWDPNGWFFS